MNDLQIEIISDGSLAHGAGNDIDRIIYDLDFQIDLLSSHADKFDFLVAIGSGLLCGMMDVLWVGDFSLERGRGIANEKVDGFVKETAKLLGYKDDDLEGAVKFLEKKFPIPADGNTPDFGGGLQHHLRDFAHHPTIVGLIFSLLTQFTNMSYGTDTSGVFITVPVSEQSRKFIGNDVPTKILFGTIQWFFHLVSDMAGSGGYAGKSGGTGIPGPLLALAKELSALPIFKSIKVGDNSLSLFLSKLFNGTLLAKHDEAGKIIKESQLRFDLRGEIGLGMEIGRQAIPVVANECIVRSFYFIRRLMMEMRNNKVRSLEDMEQIDWGKVKPLNNPTITRMLTIATGVFTTVDIGAAIATQKYWIEINYVGVGRFALAVGADVAWCLKARNVRLIKEMYENINRFAYKEFDNTLYGRINEDMEISNFGLTIEQTEILYNLEFYKTLNDIELTKTPINNDAIVRLKQNWLEEWREFISQGFKSFLQVDVELHWYSKEELIAKIDENKPEKTWLRLVMLELMLFEPYYPLSTEKDKKGNHIPSRKYKTINNPINGYKKSKGDVFLELFLGSKYAQKGYIVRLRKCHDKVLSELNEVLKGVLISLGITAIITVVIVATAGIFAGPIAVALVGSQFAGLSGAALTSACLAYLGGGAIAAGGLGMAGGMATIVGGGAVLGIGVGVGAGGAVGAISLQGKQNTIIQSTKLLVAIREIFLNDEHDIAYSNSVYEKYAQNIVEIEKGLVELRLQEDEANGKEKKELKVKIKKAEESVEAMKIAKKSLRKFMSSFEMGYTQM